MKKYELRENDNPNAPYDLLCNDTIIIKFSSYGKILKFLYQVIQPGDTYQEFHKSSYTFSTFPILSYDEVIKLKLQEEEFDKGK